MIKSHVLYQLSYGSMYRQLIAYGEQLFSGRLGERQKRYRPHISNRYYNHCIILYNNIIQILVVLEKFLNKKRSNYFLPEVCRALITCYIKQPISTQDKSWPKFLAGKKGHNYAIRVFGHIIIIRCEHSYFLLFYKFWFLLNLANNFLII